MAALLITLALLTLTVWLTTRLVDWIRQDGAGHRAPPRSHHDWTEGTDAYLHRPAAPAPAPDPAPDTSRTPHRTPAARRTGAGALRLRH